LLANEGRLDGISVDYVKGVITSVKMTSTYDERGGERTETDGSKLQ